MTFREAIERLQHDETLSLVEVRTILDSIRDKIVAPIVDLDDKYYVYRGVDYFTDPNQIQCSNDLYYPPAAKITTFGRANLPENPMFYGILPTQETSQNICACLIECSSKLRNSLSEGIFQACISRWQIKQGEKISLFCIINPEKGQQKTPFLSGLNSDYEDFTRTVEKVISYEDNILLHKFLYEQFNNEGSERNYWISAIISSNLIKAGIDGILYESVQGEKIGFNNTICVAISPLVADSKLEFLDYVFVRSNYYFPDSENRLQINIGAPSHF